MYAGKLKTEAEEDGSRVRAERESRSALVVKVLVEIPLTFEGRSGWAQAPTRLRRTRESMVSDLEGGGGYKRKKVFCVTGYFTLLSMIGNGAWGLRYVRWLTPTASSPSSLSLALSRTS